MLFYKKATVSSNFIIKYGGFWMKDIVLNNTSIWVDVSSSKWEAIYDAPKPTGIYRFVYVKCGNMMVYSKNLEFSLNAGEIIFIPSGVPFKMVLSGEDEVTNIYRVHYRYFPNVDYYDYQMQVFKPSNRIVENIEELIRFDRDLVNSEFIWKAYRLLDDFEKLMNKNQEISALKIEKALEFMRENDNYTIPQLAEMCNMSRSAFYTVFQRVVGCTPIQTKHRFQAHKAEILLKSTDFTIDEIAEKVGFQSTAHFRKVFHSRYNCSPNEIRKRTKMNASKKTKEV